LGKPNPRKDSNIFRADGIPVLVIIDLQNDFVDLAWKKEILLKNCKRLLVEARRSRIPVFHVRRSYRPDGLDVELPRLRRFSEEGWLAVGGTKGAEPPKGLEETDGEIVVVKQRWSAFFQTELDMLLRRLGAGTVVIAGLQTPNCIRATAYDAVALDYETVVVSDATTARNGKIHVSNLEDMAAAGVRVIPTAKVLAMLRA
jgi:nicotinamidase-related amidase